MKRKNKIQDEQANARKDARTVSDAATVMCTCKPGTKVHATPTTAAAQRNEKAASDSEQQQQTAQPVSANYTPTNYNVI